MRASGHLRDLSGENWIAMTHHAFTNIITTGTLYTPTLQTYLRQGYLFIDQFVRFLAPAIAHAPSLAYSRQVSHFLAPITGTENTHEPRSFDVLDCSSRAARQAKNSEFLGLMYEARLSEKYECMLAFFLETVRLEWADFEVAWAGYPAAGEPFK